MNKLFTPYSIAILFFLGIFTTFKAQCDVSAFTLTPVNGVCVQDGAINVAIPGAVSCSSVTAFLYEAGGTSDIGTIVLASNGTGTFANLGPGDYEVRLFQGTTLTPKKPVTVATSYNLLSLQGTSTNLTCNSSDPLFSQNGEIEVTFAGGAGPYTLSLSGTSSQTVNLTSTGSYTFTGLAAGSYNVTITDNSPSCVASESKSFTLTETNYPEPTFYYHRSTTSTGDCSKLYYRISLLTINGANFVANQNNCYITVNGVNYSPTQMINYGNQVVTFWDGILQDQDIITTLYLTDGCNEYIQNNIKVRKGSDTFLATQLTLNNCGTGVTIGMHGNQSVSGYAGSWAYQLTNSITIYQESAYNSDVWTQVSSQNNIAQLSYNGGFYFKQFDDSSVRYKIVASDACHTVEKIVDPTSLTYNNPLSYANVLENKGIYNGTSSFTITQYNSIGGSYYNQTLSKNANYPITVHIERVDGATSVPVVSDGPLNLAGNYNVTFPRDVVFQNSPTSSGSLYYGLTVGDLPPGEYNITLSDACDAQYNHTLTISNPADYANEVYIEPGCANSNVVYDLTGSNVWNVAIPSQLLADNSGVPGAVIRNETENPQRLLNGQFTNVPPGDYFLKLLNLKYKYAQTIGQIPNDTYSLIEDQFITYKDAFAPVKVEEYGSISFSNTSLFCDTNDPNSGIMAILVEGEPVGFLNYQIWAPGANPDTDTPIENYTTSDLTEREHVFQGLSQGIYTVRVATECGFLQQEINVVEGGFESPVPVSLTGNPICELDTNPNQLFVALSESLFDIEWKDTSTNTVIGNGNSIFVDPPPTVSTTYSVSYQLKESLGCTNTYANSQDLLLKVIPAHPLAAVGDNSPTQTGISVLNRPDRKKISDWPGNRSSANLVLEGKTLGMVINRIATTAEVEAIPDPVEGMMVFDVEADCLKMYTTIDNGATMGWYCMNTQTCANQH